MELIKKEKNWFLTEEGSNYFAALSLLEEKTVFIYSYLKLVVNESFEEDNTLFKIAFFFADAICNSDKSYSKYQNLLNSETNPFLKYLETAEKFYDNIITYVIFTSILQEKVDVSNHNEWIYDNELLKSKDLLEKLDEKDISYLQKNSTDMVDPKAYKIKKTVDFLQLSLAWMFLK